MKNTFGLIVGLAAAGAFWGCSSSSDSTGGVTPGGPQATGAFQLRFDQVELPPDVDSAQAVFLDASGNQLGEVQEVAHEALGRTFTFSQMPAGTAFVEVDYLQHGGFALFESYHVAWNIARSASVLPRFDEGEVSDPSAPKLFAATPARTIWSTALNPARLQVAASGNPGRDQGPSDPAPFTVKGVAYSPAPIGYTNKNAPSFGDLFWDGFFIQGAGNLLDFNKVWRRDLEEIRSRFNSVRLYALLSEHANPGGQFENPPISRVHTKFLHECWNNGNDPLYVLIGVPLPSDCFEEGGNLQNRANWERVLTATLAEVKDHPAVLGFTIFNEQGGTDAWGGNGPASNFYWSQVEKYSAQVKAAAPDKLVGFAYFDNPGNVNLAQANGLLEQFGGNLDYWGVNAFQATTIGPSLAPYKALTGAKKPVLFTEFSVPATSHSVDEVCDGAFPTQAGVNSIFADGVTIGKAATAMATMIPTLLNDEIVAGLFYFEWCDEWWKQDPKPGCYDTSITAQEGGPAAAIGQMPNGFDDQEGYGLFSIGLGNRQASAVYDPFNANAATANNRPDVLTPRTALLEAVKQAFGKLR